MIQWYHSGIEGYCKSAAQLMGLPDDQSGWGNFGNDLFGDGRFDDPVKASKTWTLSRFRKQGRSNRPMLFEKSWVGESGLDYEYPAVIACANAIADPDNDSMLFNMYKSNYLSFAMGFHDTVLPAIADGFRTERYHSSDIARFSQTLDVLLGELRPSRPKTLLNFARSLVAGLIYGPNHFLARISGGDATSLRTQSGTTDSDSYGDVDETSIRITQLFSDNSAYMGYSELFDDGKVIFLGRNSDAKLFLEKCNPAFAEEVEGLEAVFYPISNAHRRTSNEHAAIARLGGTWYYHDFSTNGSFIDDGKSRNPVHGGMAIVNPGDRICLGLEDPSSSGEDRYRMATVVLVSFNIQETSLM